MLWQAMYKTSTRYLILSLLLRYLCSLEKLASAYLTSSRALHGLSIPQSVTIDELANSHRCAWRKSHHIHHGPIDRFLTDFVVL